jgi:hypothetical protein
MTKKEIIDYVRGEAENCGVPFSHAIVLFDLLGESEMYDGFVTMLEDYGKSLNWEGGE